MTRPLDGFADIHCHDLSRATSGTAVVSVSPGTELQPGGTYSVGIHPWDTVGLPSLSTLKALVAAARDPRVVAVGECGFDTLRGGTPECQRRVFDFQARLAERVGKPLIIHAVRSDTALIAAKRRLHPSQRWIIHGFRGNPVQAGQLLREGFSLSLGKRFNPAVPAVVPPDRLYRESDS